MADAAPGHAASSRNDPPCYNCGLQGHYFNACPEPARATPAGLEAARARRQPDENERGERRGKGPIVTRYPQPPRGAPVVTRYEPAHGGYGSSGYGAHSSQPTYPPPPPSFGFPQPPPPPNYGAPGFPAPGFAPPGSPPFSPHGPPGLPAPPTGPHGLPPPPGHPRNQPYYGSPGYANSPPPYAPPFGPPDPSRPPMPPGPYQQGPNPHYAPYPPYPPQSSAHPYPSPQYPPQPYGYPQPPSAGYPRYDEYDHPSQAFQDSRDVLHYDRGLPRPPPDHHSRDHHSGPPRRWRPKDSRDDPGQHERGPHEHNTKAPIHVRDNSSREWQSNDAARGSAFNRKDSSRRQDRISNQGHGRQEGYGNKRRQRQKSFDSPQRRRSESQGLDGYIVPTADPPQKEPESDQIKAEVELAQLDRDISFTTDNMSAEEVQNWDEETIFKEADSTPKADAIAKPLPSKYTEDVMLPPAFDAAGLTSTYIVPNNIDDFALSIRETKEWQTYQHHPLFLDPLLINIRALENFLHRSHMGNRHDRRGRGGNPSDIGRPKNPHTRDHRRGLEDKRRRKWQEYREDHDHRLSDPGSFGVRHEVEHKRQRVENSPEPGEVIETATAVAASVSQPAAPPDIYDGPSEAETSLHGVDSKPYMPTESDRDETVTEPNRQGRPESEVLDHVSQANQNKRMPDISWHRSLPEEVSSAPTGSPTQGGRRSSKGSWHESPPASRRSSAGNISLPSSEASSLDAIEAELLGLSKPSSSGGDEDVAQKVDEHTPKFKRRQPRVDAAYSRRW